MQIVAGGQYTFHFSTTGNSVLGTMGQIDSLAAQGIMDAGFPISISSHGLDESGGFLGLEGTGTFSISFTYNGQSTDDNSLGNAMQDALNNSNAFGYLSGISVNYESADAGNVTGGVVNTVAQNAPSLSTIGIGVLAIGLLAILVFSFGQGLGKGVA